MQDCKVNILGTEWTIKFGSEEEYPALNGIDGYADSSEKEIVVDNMERAKDNLMQKGILNDTRKKFCAMSLFMPLCRNLVWNIILSISRLELKKQWWIGLLFSPRRCLRYFRSWTFCRRRNEKMQTVRKRTSKRMEYRYLP